MAATPNCQVVESAVLAKFADARFGRFNCRHVSSDPNKIWSQHAASEPAKRYFGNGLDITHQQYGYSSHPLHQIWLLRVKAFIRANFPEITRLLLGPGNRNHSNHVHFDAWPKMLDEPSYTPPCKGGKLVVVHKGGTRGSTFGSLVPPPPPPSTEDEMALRRNDTGEAVGYFQRALIAYDGPGILPDFGADEDFGAETEAAVKKFQTNAMGLEQTADGVTGIIEGPTAAMLHRYYLLKYEVHERNQPSVTATAADPVARAAANLASQEAATADDKAVVAGVEADRANTRLDNV